jgi:ADP-ribose pyrophosphatase YjhB (NUDIX family)
MGYSADHIHLTKGEEITQMNQFLLPTAGLIIVKEKKLLLAFSKNKKAFYLPGGKVDAGETAIQALIREVSEEMNLHILPQELAFFMHISAPAFGEQPHIIMEQDCFMYALQSRLTPGAEIGELRFFSFQDYLQEKHLVPGVIILFEELQKRGLI